VPIACQLIAGGMAQHVRMELERKTCFPPRPLDHPIEAIRCERSAAFAHEHKRRFWSLTLQLPQHPELIAANGMRAWLPALYSADMKCCGVPVNLLPPAWFFWLSPLNAAYARTRPGPKRDDIAKTYFEIVEAVGFGGRAKIQRTPREATT
jgi:hypothetical protein